ncbi:guanitoxin biosynthesis heme-dependent pre-guanitoxin N-hydroxylase GntA [Variovorax sp. J22G73]|uniref:guanitoxin biosynthesis heme-dependent pre-guanitoxin N-hydroxylase GntA n=1 Tax=unclassified Variovorax TaxID=663243 RepID=UPI002578FE31|nr:MULTISPECIES: guanitoxin biosynthesis heme-dependent pre-guanitoxin N-hydroxylase GntA [unclassified Variovorax]MDM0009495.1 guanitoxin biosynthesis heme-dependent pre-guanitoxin N-hydroxylase GntA [Variovorax sp. J22R203]MDM0102003.1 guanitoxin biosynthesis heme-dependent pre-guanitoxin N-hydroxylase GntA [Variovorax sp. J22G73]
MKFHSHLPSQAEHTVAALQLRCPVDSSSARDEMSSFISDTSFPCVGAKSALNKDRMRFGDFGELGNPAGAAALCDALLAYSAEFEAPGSSPVSFIALFTADGQDEAKFERQLWQMLQAMHDLDKARGFAWDPQVSQDPNRGDFSFSIGGRAFFVVGLHPHSSRLARRAPVPCLVFNFHEQFETLKASGKYQSMQTAIRARDVTLQGTVNPVLESFGKSSEARQYSGRAVETDWKCPFHQ